MQSFDEKMKSYYNRRGGDNMEKEKKKVYTLRIPESLHFQVEKAVVAEGFKTTNSWLISVVENHLKNVKNKGSK